jgi:hypothetical protein
MLTQGFFRLAISAATTGVEITLRQVFLALELDLTLPTLERLDLTRTALRGANLIIRPDFDLGDLDTVRLLCSPASPVDAAALLGELGPGEGAFVEFKQSVFFNWRRFQSQPDAAAADLQSDEVTFSFLKTVAAFLNSWGGRLFVGVKDDASLCGIEKDFIYCKSHNEDGWQLKIRDLLKTRFHEGDLVNNYVDVEIAHANNLSIAKINVSKRSKLSFLKIKDRYHLFCRQGNRTIEIGIENVEEFLQNRGEASKQLRSG